MQSLLAGRLPFRIVVLIVVDMLSLMELKKLLFHTKKSQII